MKRILFVFNHHAGKRKNWTVLPDILDAMTAQGCLVTAYPSQSPGDAATAVAQWGSDFDHVVVAGGDGTLSEAIAGAMQCAQPPTIGYIPMGTTNDFSRNLHLPEGEDFAALARIAVSGTPNTHDLGWFNGQSFLYVAAFGAFTEIAYSTPQTFKNMLGYHAYVLEFVKYLNTMKPHHMRIEWEDKVLEGDYIYGMVSNTLSVGRFDHFPPGSPDLSDGLLDVTLISPLREAKDIEGIAKALLSMDPSAMHSMVKSFSAKSVTFLSPNPLPWTLDGEVGGTHSRVEITAEHKAFTILHGDAPLRPRKRHLILEESQ